MIHLYYAELCAGLRRKVCPLVAALASALLIPGCGGGNSAGNSPASTPPPDPPITASVHGLTGGGHTVIKGASVTLYRVGTGGYGSPAAVLGRSTTDASGAWTLTFAMPADDPLVYVTASGGGLGRGANRAIALLAALGPLSGVPPVVTVNEVTTVASVYSLARFLDVDTATNVGAPASNGIGIANAFGTVANLVDFRLGAAIASADAFTPIVNPVTHASEAPPERVIDSLANIVSACIDSSGPTSSGCTTLFSVVTPPGGGAPADTRQAMLDIALNPANNVSKLFDLSNTSNVPFTPDLGGAVPNDWMLAINFTGGALGDMVPKGIAIGATGDVWIASRKCNPVITSGSGCVIGLHSQGSPIGPYPGLQSNTQEFVSPVGFFPGPLAVDAGGSPPSGGPLGLSTIGTSPQGIAIDPSGNVWVATGEAEGVVELIGAAVPVKTPRNGPVVRP